MSSFVIKKSEYMKAAGLVSGLAQELKLWLYDYETQRNSTPEDYRRKFEECFTMNCLSVQEQYRENEPWTDSNAYKAEFEQFQKLGKQLVYNGGESLTNAIRELQSFLDSALYQTEKEAYMYKMEMFFNNIICQLYKKASHYEAQSWSQLKITPPSNTYSRII